METQNISITCAYECLYQISNKTYHHHHHPLSLSCYVLSSPCVRHPRVTTPVVCPAEPSHQPRGASVREADAVQKPQEGRHEPATAGEAAGRLDAACEGTWMTGWCMVRVDVLTTAGHGVSYLLMPVGSQAIDQGTPLFSVRGHPLHLSPGVTHLFRFSFCVSLFMCFGAYLFASSLWVPCDGLTGDGFLRFPECVSYPPSFNFFFIFYV